MKKEKRNINRRKFVGDITTSAAAFTIVPRHVLGRGHIAPSDKILVANIGCGTQGIYEMPNLLEDERIQVVAVCDVNKYTTDYKDWSNLRVKRTIRNCTGDQTWGQFIKGIPAGRDIGQNFVETYYGNKSASGTYQGCSAYEDYRELLAKESDLDVIKIMTPDHSHGCIALDSMKKGKHVITHKPISNRLREGMTVIDAAETYHVKTHLLAWEDKPNYRLIKSWIDDGVIGQVKEIHNWSMRPVWPQYFGSFDEEMVIPDGFNWQLWLGPEQDRPYHLNYTHNVFRGWYDFGGGSIADMGHYSLFPLFREFGIDRAPTSVRAYGTDYRTSVDGVCQAINNDASFPYSCMIKFKFPDQEVLPAFDFYWYDGGMKPFAPQELEEAGEDLAREGMLFIGDKGKILSGFQGEHPRLLGSLASSYDGPLTTEVRTPERRSDTWIRAIVEDKESPGSFRYARTITELVNLGAAGLRSKKRLNYDSSTYTITNDIKADSYLSRNYREGWEVTL